MSAAQNLNLYVQFVTETCCRETCNLVFAMSQDFHNDKRKDQSTWFCPRGHPQHYTGPTEQTKLKRRLEFEKNRREDAERQVARARAATAHQKRRAAAFKGQVTKARKRVGNGVCPCCNRTFQQLARHMANKHPTYSEPPKG